MLATLLHNPGISLTVSQLGKQTRGCSSPGLAGLPRPQRGGLHRPNGTVTLAGITLPCMAWSFTEGFKPGHDVHE
jgi:hypothetical protein